MEQTTAAGSSRGHANDTHFGGTVNPDLKAKISSQKSNQSQVRLCGGRTVVSPVSQLTQTELCASPSLPVYMETSQEAKQDCC